MTPDDLPATKQDLAALEQRLTEGLTQSLTQSLTQVFHQALDRAMDAMIGNVSDLRQEMNRRTDRIEVHIQTLILQTAGMSKSLTDAERLDTATAAALSGQQRAIDDLYAKLAELQRRIEQRPPQ